MAQFARPSSDVSTGSWATTPLWSKIDDDLAVNPAGDGTVITSDAVGNNTDTSVFEVALSSVTDPEVGTGHVIRLRCRTLGAAMTVTVALYEGATQRSTDTSTNLSGTEAEVTFTLSETEANSITAYTDLRFRINGRGTAGGPARSLEIDSAELEVPDAPSGETVTLDTGGVAIAGSDLTIGVTAITLDTGAIAVAGSDLVIDANNAGDILSATFWLRAEDADLTLDGSDGVSAGVNMGSAGSAMDLSQSTEADRPIRVANVVNNKAVLRFAGSGDELVTPSVAGTTFAAADQNVVFLVLQADSLTDTNTSFYWGADTDVLNNYGVHATCSDGVIYFDSANITGGRISVSAPAGWLTGFHILELVRDGVNGEILVDGTSLVSSSSMSGSISGSSDVFHVGSRIDDFYFLGDLAEIIVANGATAVSSGTRASARQALADYYNITIEGGGDTVVLDTGSVAVAGAEFSPNAVVLLDTGAVTVAGSDLSPNTAVSLDTGSVAVAGNDLTIGVTAITLDTGAVAAAGDDLSPNVTVSLDTGSTAVAGSDLAPNAAVLLDNGNVAVVGADLAPNATMTLDTGATAAAGSDLSPNLAVLLDNGSVAVAGNDLVVIAAQTIALDTGTVAVAGNDLAPKAAVTLDTGAVAAVGFDLAPNSSILLDTGAVAIAGNDLTILAAQTVTLDDGTVVATGADLNLLESIVLDAGAVTVSGSDLSPNTLVTLDPGNIAIAGTDLGIALAHTLDLGSIAVAGSDLALNQIVQPDTGSIVVAGADIDPVVPNTVLLDNGTVAIVGFDLAISGGVGEGSSVALGTSISYKDSVGWLDVNDGDSIVGKVTS